MASVVQLPAAEAAAAVAVRKASSESQRNKMDEHKAKEDETEGNHTVNAEVKMVKKGLALNESDILYRTGGHVVYDRRNQSAGTLVRGNARMNVQTMSMEMSLCIICDGRRVKVSAVRMGYPNRCFQLLPPPPSFFLLLGSLYHCQRASRTPHAPRVLNAPY